MIFLAYDYVTKYENVMTYLIGRAISEKYAIPYIERAISYSKTFGDFEHSNVTEIAFNSEERNYENIFPQYPNKGYFPDLYHEIGWMGYAYIQLFLTVKTTFENLFLVIPLMDMFKLYPLYHEMSASQLVDLFKQRIKYSFLDLHMKAKKISSEELSRLSGVSKATISAVRYGHRSIDKLEGSSLIKIAYALGVKSESLLDSIPLDLEHLEHN